MKETKREGPEWWKKTKQNKGREWSKGPNAAEKSSHIRTETAHWVFWQHGGLETQAKLLAENN